MHMCYQTHHLRHNLATSTSINNTESNGKLLWLFLPWQSQPRHQEWRSDMLPGVTLYLYLHFDHRHKTWVLFLLWFLKRENWRRLFRWICSFISGSVEVSSWTELTKIDQVWLFHFTIWSKISLVLFYCFKVLLEILLKNNSFWKSTFQFPCHLSWWWINHQKSRRFCPSP